MGVYGALGMYLYLLNQLEQHEMIYLNTFTIGAALSIATFLLTYVFV